MGIVHLQWHFGLLSGIGRLAGTRHWWVYPLAPALAAQGYFGPRLAGFFFALFLEYHFFYQVPSSTSPTILVLHQTLKFYYQKVGYLLIIE